MKLFGNDCGVNKPAHVPRCLLVASALSLAFGTHPEFLSSKGDIEKAKPNIKSAYIEELPLQYYPLLTRFTQLRQLSYYSPDSTLATDDKLRALASLNLTNLADITLLNGRHITDEGILALSKIKSLTSLQLEGTGITDKALGILATNTRIQGVNVANCDGVTPKGLQTLVTSESLEDVSFSANQMSTEDVLNLFASFKKTTWCEIMDPQGRLDAAALKKAASERGFHLLVRPTGALQDMEKYK